MFPGTYVVVIFALVVSVSVHQRICARTRARTYASPPTEAHTHGRPRTHALAHAHTDTCTLSYARTVTHELERARTHVRAPASAQKPRA